MILRHAPHTAWDQAHHLLLSGATEDLDRGHPPLPVLAAAIDEELVALGVLRPFDATEGPLPPVVELLALLLPLGVDRIALLLPGRAWQQDEPAGDGLGGNGSTGDAQHVVVLVVADGRESPCRLQAELREIEWCDGTEVLGPPRAADDPQDSPLLAALQLLLERRRELVDDAHTTSILGQLARILLLGHELAMAPDLHAELVHRSGGPIRRTA